MDPMMAFVVGWTLVCAFVFTVIVTCLSLVGWAKFTDPKQQRKLFQVLVVEIVVGVGAKLLDVASFSPSTTKAQVASVGANRALQGLLAESLNQKSLTREQATFIIDRIEAPQGSKLADEKRQLQEEITRLPAGTITPEAATKISPMINRFDPSVRRPR
ncbi:MAG: hypothetical protein L0Y44_11315 [Phycisphaerales bacterium]|nr:hypothetical protein [Phycisphaerales bacterium]MCI0675248.1 hypothetical protein [Phycisphaerales bacterium]